MLDLSKKRNGRKINVLYPTHGNSNVLRKVNGIKVASYTGPAGKGITVREFGGQFVSLTLSKIVKSLG